MKTLFANSHAEILDARIVLPDTLLIHWADFWTHENSVCLKTLEHISLLVKEHKPKIFLSDYSQFQVYTDKMLEHLVQVWYPELLAQGLIMELYIVSEDLVGEANLEDKFEQLEYHAPALIAPKVESYDHAQSIIREYWKLY